MLPSKEKIEEIIKELQKIMRLQDWDIETEIVDNFYMVKKWPEKDMQEYVRGYHDTDLRHQLSIIRLNKDHPSMAEGWYQTLVHELFHVFLMRFVDTADYALRYLNEDGLKEIAHESFNLEHENTVARLTRIFVSLYPVTNFIKEDENVT
jgi:hypothetical protein